MAKKVYIIENLDCANCAAKIEQKILALPEIEDASITYATKQLRITAEDPDSLIPEITRIANTVESDVIITERRRSRRQSSGTDAHNHGHAHHHGDACGCGHDHDHEHEHHHHDDA
ncbi:MAG: heavy-metal-associated domain-containing protein, partial [Eubacterium sp.]|nr:heavy-metal-associated domain-containing protein [Eubacterium sp.]